MVNSLIVVLGATSTNEQKPTPSLLRRTLSGCALAKEMGGATLLFTGGCTNSTHDVSEAEVMQAIAYEKDIPKDCILLEKKAKNTLENGVFSLPIIQSKDWKRIIVVSDRFHLWRARLVFASFGVKASYKVAKIGPKAKSGQLFSLLYELVALIWYSFRIVNGDHRKY